MPTTSVPGTNATNTASQNNALATIYSIGLNVQALNNACSSSRTQPTTSGGGSRTKRTKRRKQTKRTKRRKRKIMWGCGNPTKRRNGRKGRKGRKGKIMWGCGKH